MKKIILLYILSFTLIFPNGNTDSYRSFAKGKTNYLSGDNEQASLEFQNFLTNYKSSRLYNSHYSDYYIGMNFYEIGDLQNALKFLDSSIYTPKYLKFSGSNRSNYFEFERAFYLGEIYAQLGSTTNSETQYRSLIKNFYTPELEPFEKKALNILASKDPYYRYILEVKYQNNYQHLKDLKKADLVMVANFLYSKGLFLEFYEAYNKDFQTGNSNNKEMIIYTLRVLEEIGEYDLMIDLIKKQPLISSDYYYYFGNALKKSGKSLEAIEKYKLVDMPPYSKDAIYSISRLYFILEDYDNTILWSHKLKDDRSHELLTRSYFNSGQIDLFKKSAIQYITRYPNSDLAAYYRNLLYNESKNPNYLKWIIKHNLNSYYYQVAFNITKSTRELEVYPINYKLRVHKDSLDSLDEISTLGDPQLLLIEADSINFPNDKTFEYYIRTIYLERSQLYDLAMYSSLLAESEFSKYSNLHLLLYPKYYEQIVKKYSKEYDVEEALIFSIIKESSKFDKNLIDKSTYFGLMQVSLKTARESYPKITPKELLDPETNIKIGVKRLSILLTKHENNTSLAIADYHEDKKITPTWKLDKNGDIDVEQIPYLDSQKFIKSVIADYYKYKNLYKN
jgi:soluble lytic murein transglycosylase